MRVKPSSTTHHVMLILASAKNKPKTVSGLYSICLKDIYRIRRALDQLSRYGFVEVHTDSDSEQYYRLSPEGKTYLLDMVSN